MTAATAPAEHFLPIADIDEWDAFWRENGHALADEIGDEATCMRLALNCSLLVGGGAGPLFRVGFVD